MKFQFIDTIRGIAILMVILVHTSAGIQNLDKITDVITKYSQMGVQLFFVASSFTLCLSFENRSNENTPLLNYGIRRFFRIAPIYWLGILLYLILAAAAVFSEDLINIGNYTSFNLFSNFFFLHGFVESANNTIVPGGWSIATEVCFYLIFPLIFKFSRYHIKNIRSLIQFVVIGVIVSQTALYFMRSGFYLANNTFLYFNIMNQLPCFFIGIGYFYYTKLVIKKYNYYVYIGGFILFTILCLLLWYLNIGYLFSWTPILSSLSFVFLIELFRNNSQYNIHILSEIGKVSFSMYLFHFIFTYSLAFLPSKLTSSGIISLSVSFLFIVFLTYFVGRVSYVLIEKPFINVGKSLIKKLNLSRQQVT